MKKYLPSKKFIIITSIIIGVAGIFLAGMNYYFSKKNDKGLITNVANLVTGQDLNENFSLKDLIQKDSDGDGVPDWEEALWGTDPNNKTTHEGIADADWISRQKKELAVKSGIAETKPLDNLNETDKFSREFFSTVAALRQSGNLDQGTVSNISNILGNKISSVNLPDNYRITDLKKTYDVTKKSQANFYNVISNTFLKYKNEGLGDELDVINQIVTGQIDQSGVAILIKISQAYQNFAKEIKDTTVPNNLVQNDLGILNGAYNTGLAVINLSKIADDPLAGLIGLSQYQKYSEQFIRTSEDLRTYLIKSDIIKG